MRFRCEIAGRWPGSGGGRSRGVIYSELMLVVEKSGRYEEVVAVEGWSLIGVRLYYPTSYRRFIDVVCLNMHIDVICVSMR